MPRWLSPQRGTAALITTIVHAEQPVDHDLLDTLPQGHLLHRLRAVLVTGGVLPERPEFLDRIDPWLETQLADRPAAHAQLVRTRARWTLLRRARRRLSRRPFTDGAAHYQRACLMAAIRLLDWLDDQNLALADLAQADVDRWLADNPHEYAYLAKEFLRWARNRQLVGDVVITQRRRSHNPATLSEDGHWQHLRRCLHDQTLPLDVRAAGSLILLYGITAARISRLHHDELELDENGTWLRVGRHRLRIVPQAAHRPRRHNRIYPVPPQPQRPDQAGCFPAANPADTPQPSTSDSTSMGCHMPPTDGPPHSSTSPPTYPRPCWLTCLASASTPPTNGPNTPAATGRPTSPPADSRSPADGEDLPFVSALSPPHARRSPNGKVDASQNRLRRLCGQKHPECDQVG